MKWLGDFGYYVMSFRDFYTSPNVTKIVKSGGYIRLDLQIWLGRQLDNLFESGHLEDQEWELEENIEMNIKEINCGDGKWTQNLV
jgi:hypothetical protein